MSEQGSESNRSRLVWRCRRGVKELDLLLLGWLNTQFEGASPQLKAGFEALLELPDPLLLRYVLGKEAPEQAQLAAVIDAIVNRDRLISG